MPSPGPPKHTTMERGKTPILFLIFNRPDTTRQVFSVIREIKPTRLFIAADGPRADRSGDAKLCKETRQIIKEIDWPCQVQTLFRDNNLGCKIAVSSAIDWFFDQVEEGIILEDDCLPDPSFFPYCSALLEKYRNRDNIMLISGTNLLGKWKEDKQSYHFSVYGGIWGWASWRRAWKKYDVEMKDWPDQETKQAIRKFMGSQKQYKERAFRFDRVFRGKIDTWDYQWSFTRLKNQGLSIVPAVNLVKNIGFGTEATHTIDSASYNYPDQQSLSLNLPGDPTEQPDKEYDRAFYSTFLADKRGLWTRISKILSDKLHYFFTRINFIRS